MQEVEAFFAEIRSTQKFIAAAAVNSEIEQLLEGMERGLRQIYDLGADDARLMEIFDDIRRLLASGRTIKQKCLGLIPLAERARAGRQ